MDLETVEQIVALLGEHRISEISVESEGLRVVARKPLSPVFSLPEPTGLNALEEMTEVFAGDAAASAAESILLPEPLVLTAGMVGLFRHTEPPLGYGTRVTPGQIVGSIEAMKVLNDARAEMGGQVVDVYVEEGAPVEYGQALFRLMPAES
jgi:acetyl-CoA carboxylase biotin carboxyl carrier protein